MNINSLNQWQAWAKSFPNKADAAKPYVSPFRVVNKTKEAAEILIYDEIGRDFLGGEGMAANDFAALLKEIEPGAALTIAINSPGGNVRDGLAIHNQLAAWKGKVTTRNDGVAASIASVILQAGAERQSNASAMVMIHRAWGMMVGNADDAAQFQKDLEKHDQVISELYARRSGLPEQGFKDAMAEETIYTGTEAKAAGLVDTVLTPAKTENNLTAQAVEPGIQMSAAGNNKTRKNSMEPNTPAPAAPTPPVQDLTPLLEAIKALGDKLTPAPLPGTAPLNSSGIENRGNPLVEKYNDIYDVEEKGKLAKVRFHDLRKQLLVANSVKDLPANYDMFDFRNPQIRNANTVDAALANTILSADFVTTMRTYIAPWGAFTRRVELSPVSRRQTLEVPLASTAGSKAQDATNYESGDSTLAPIAVVVNEESRSFHVNRPQQNIGLQLAALVPTNAKVLAEGIHAKMTALMIVANYGATTTIGAAANFDSADLPAILALGKNYDSVRLLLDGGHLAYLLPTALTSFKFGDPGAFGFDGGIYKNNLWTSAVANSAGFVCGPDAIVNAWGMADGLPAGEFLSQSTVDVNGIPFGLSVWFSRATRFVWASFQVMHGCAVGDATQGECLVTS